MHTTYDVHRSSPQVSINSHSRGIGSSSDGTLVNIINNIKPKCKIILFKERELLNHIDMLYNASLNIASYLLIYVIITVGSYLKNNMGKGRKKRLYLYVFKVQP